MLKLNHMTEPVFNSKNIQHQFKENINYYILFALCCSHGAFYRTQVVKGDWKYSGRVLTGF